MLLSAISRTKELPTKGGQPKSRSLLMGKAIHYADRFNYDPYSTTNTELYLEICDPHECGECERACNCRSARIRTTDGTVHFFAATAHGLAELRMDLGPA
jgi:hypothetical protein